MNVITRHSVAIFAVSAALFGLGVGASNLYQISMDESHHYAMEGQ